MVQPKVKSETETAQATNTQSVEESKKAGISITERKKRVSGLSLSSIKAKKVHESQKVDEVDHKNLPTKPFEEKDMQRHWNDFVNKIEKNGKKILASNLQADIPRKKGEHTLWIELPNSTMKKEVEREQGPLIQYLREKLQNYNIELQISVNEEVAKKFAFTPQEKFEKLREKNPALDILRREFDLDF